MLNTAAVNGTLIAASDKNLEAQSGRAADAQSGHCHGRRRHGLHT